METLKKIFKEQKDFQKFFYDPDNISKKDKIKFTKEYILSVHRELSEVLDTISWKIHRKEDKVISETNTKEEIIDCFKFLLNLCIIWEIDENEFVKEFFRKSAVVRQRYGQEILNSIKKDDLVCAIDLDDTLSQSAEYFTKIYNEKHNTNFSNKKEIKEKIPILEYEKFKHYFRESGEKINIPVKKYAKELCLYLRKIGYKIIIISSRPYKIYSRIYSDTLEWLNKNNIKYDSLYFEENKHLKILKFLPNMSFIIEDDMKYAKQIAEQKYKVYLLSSEKINMHDKYICKIDNLKEMINILKNEETTGKIKRKTGQVQQLPF